VVERIVPGKEGEKSTRQNLHRSRQQKILGRKDLKKIEKKEGTSGDPKKKKKTNTERTNERKKRQRASAERRFDQNGRENQSRQKPQKKKMEGLPLIKS